MSLDLLGWTPSFENAFASYLEQGLEPARVAREDRGHYLLLERAGERSAELSGRLRHETATRAERPAVGDWVAFRAGTAGRAAIVAVLPRASAFVRKVAGETTEEQVVAANVDTAFLVAGLDHDLNLRRIERYLAAAWESGAAPVVLLNKADLEADLDERIGEVQAVALGAPVRAVSALAHRGLETLAPWLGAGQTIALLGSSGVGKSTLVNALLGESRQETAAVREEDSRGRHTTTRRELIRLPAGAMLIDTPGMRELQLWSAEETLAGTFPEIVALAEDCRFRDCRHAGEPGCAVDAAVQDGRVDSSRLGSWHKLQRELHRLATRLDARARAAEVARWKAIKKSMKHHPNAKRWK